MISRPPAVSAVVAAALMALLCVAASAQDAPKVTEYTDFSLGLGMQHQSIDGNERFFDRYVTPPSGLYLSRLVWERLDYAGGPSFSLEGRDLGEPGPSGSFWLYGSGLNLDAAYRRSSFFQEYDTTSDRSRRRDYGIVLTPDADSELRYFWGLHSNDVAVQGTPSSGPVDWADRNNGVSLSLKSSRAWFDLAFNREDFDLGSGQGFSGDTQSYGLSISPATDEKTQISLALARHTTHLDDFAADVQSWDANVMAFYRASDTLDLTGQVRRFSIDQTITQNAYAKRQLAGRVEAEYRWRPGTTVTAFYQNADTAYVDGRQANEVSVGSNSAGVAVRSRLSRAMKVTGKFSRYDTNDRPLSYNVDNSFAPSLIYSTIKRLDLSATYAPAGLWGVTGEFQRHTWDNDAQDIGNSVKTLALTGWWQACRGALSMTASFMRQEFHLPLFDVGTQLGYDTRTTSWVLGANYALNQVTGLYATYADADTSGAASDFSRRLTLGATRNVGRDDHLLVEANLGNYDDDFASDLNYDADLYRLEWQHKF